jgi:hypothetical protein
MPPNFEEHDEELQPIGPIPAVFFEKWPLYRKYRWQSPPGFHQLVQTWPTINMPCGLCGRNETFTKCDFKVDPITLQGRGSIVSSASPAGHTAAIWFVCQGCKKAEYAFLFRVSDDLKHLQKVGQYPPWSIEVEKPVAEALGQYIEWYKKGLVNESQGYGIGAFAYYRRIVEHTINGLLEDMIGFVANEPGHTEFDAAWKQIKASHSGEEKIHAVKDLLPGSLRPNGINPLAILYDELSKGIHAKTDEACLDSAATIRETLVFLVDEVTRRKKATKEYAARMAEIAKKRK